MKKKIWKGLLISLIPVQIYMMLMDRLFSDPLSIMEYVFVIPRNIIEAFNEPHWLWTIIDLAFVVVPIICGVSVAWHDRKWGRILLSSIAGLVVVFLIGMAFALVWMVIDSFESDFIGNLIVLILIPACFMPVSWVIEIFIE